MIELKVYEDLDDYIGYDDTPPLMYDKSEADKFIADLEESHKMEVEQLLMEIAELKKACNDKDDWCLHTLKENRHQKYKRCLAMADKCESMCYWFSARFDHHELVDNVKWELFDRWRLRWAKLADKFKEAK